MKHGFIKVAAGCAKIRVADPGYNVSELIRIAKQATDCDVRVLVFPELCITGATAGDLFLSQALLKSAKKALAEYLKATAKIDMISVLGLPLARANKIYDTAAVCHQGRVLGFVPKTALTASEARVFASGSLENCGPEVVFEGQSVPFGTDLIFANDTIDEMKIAVEFGADTASLIPPSSYSTAAGAALICSPAASVEIVSSGERIRNLLTAQSARTVASYVYASAGAGESTTDVVMSGRAMIAENGNLLAETGAFNAQELTVTEVDLQKSLYDRRRTAAYPSADGFDFREIPFSMKATDTALTRFVDPHPFFPATLCDPAARCRTILDIQTAGLKQRIERAFAKKLVIGISGGLDSTLALLVAVRAIDALKRPRTDIIAVTMPGFGTTKRTKSNATLLCEELGTDFRCVSIAKAVELHFEDIGHDPAVRDVTYENCQARERTQVLMDIANDCGGMVIGTGDLSELALGWATYNGDHMSMYGVNAGIPKTLIRHVVSYSADQYAAEGATKIAVALRDVLDTPVSPELLPADDKGEIAQKTEDLVGPYELHDFYLYYLIRYGFAPEKLYVLAKNAFNGQYDDATLKKWLNVLLRRFFAQQFKRSCSPDGPKIGSVSLSPRGDWAMPSDASSAAWLAEAEKI